MGKDGEEKEHLLEALWNFKVDDTSSLQKMCIECG